MTLVSVAPRPVMAKPLPAMGRLTRVLAIPQGSPLYNPGPKTRGELVPAIPLVYATHPATQTDDMIGFLDTNIYESLRAYIASKTREQMKKDLQRTEEELKTVREKRRRLQLDVEMDIGTPKKSRSIRSDTSSDGASDITDDWHDDQCDGRGDPDDWDGLEDWSDGEGAESDGDGSDLWDALEFTS